FLSVQTEKSDFSARERNRDEVRVIAVTPPTLAARRAEETRKAMNSLVGAACVEFSGIAPADAQRARDSVAALQLGTRLSERRIEEITRHWVFVPPARDRRTAEAAMAQLRRQGVAELSIRPDNSISLGVFSTEEAARRFLQSLQAKGVQGLEQGPFVRELRELVMLIREPDTELVSRLAVLQREFANSQLRAVPCPAQ
ncbi:MAG TPA: hypothetical protein VFK48_05465, partial [Usitatibacter sp.]|nr:hypothetical protein [Usitatibacter sp.]